MSELVQIATMHEQRQTYGTPQDKKSAPTRTCPSCGLVLDQSVTVCPQDGTQLVQSIAAEPEFYGKYEFLSTIGAGGMGVIYKARQILLDKLVAIKMLHAHLVSAETIQRFQLEGKAASLLSHPYIVAVHDFGTTRSGQPYMIMDYVEGRTLAQSLAQDGQLPIDRFLSIFIQVTDGLAHAHKKGVFHRDIKPTNIMLVRGEYGYEEVRIMDFGIAKLLESIHGSQQLTKTGEAVGSPIYMSPEQARGQKTDHHSDIYSLGCVMYEALTGAPPFLGATALDTMMMHVNTSALPIAEASMGNKVDPRLEWLIMKLLEKDPEDRPQSMDEVKEALTHIQQPELASHTAAPTMAAPAQTSKQVTSNTPARVILPWLITLIVLGTVGGSFAYFYNQYTEQVKAKAAKAAPAAAAKPSLAEQTSAMMLAGSDKEGTMTAKDIFTMDVTRCERTINNAPDRLFATDPPTDDDVKILQGDLCAREVTLKKAAMTDRGLEYLSVLKLNKLCIDGSLNVHDLHALKKMVTLDDFSAEKCAGLNAAAYKAIGNLPQLSNLSLSTTLITDADLPKLYKLRKLDNLRIVDCTNLTEGAVKRLKEKLPTTHIFFSTGINDKTDHALIQGTLLDQADALNNKQQWAAAIKEYNQAVSWLNKFQHQDRSSYERCYEGLGDCFSGQHKSREALTNYAKAADTTDRNSFKSLMLSHKEAAAYEQMGNLPEAIKVRRAANQRFSSIAASIGNPEEKKTWSQFLAVSLNLMGNDYNALHDNTKAIDAYKAALDVLSTIDGLKSEPAADVMMRLGETYMSSNELQDALKYIPNARENYLSMPAPPGSPLAVKQHQATTTTAVLYLGLKRTSEAIELLKEVVKADRSEPPDQRVARLNLLINALHSAKEKEPADQYVAQRNQLLHSIRTK